MNVHRPFLLACLLAPAVNAAEISASDTIVVTATRSEIPITDAIVPVTVISREDIELSGAADLAELLRFQAGIDIGRNGGPGQATSVFLRGTESNHVLVLVDGVRMNPGTIGGAAFQHVSPEVIERVEIVKGARSALYGTDAIGGVINIITRRGDSTIEAGLGLGSFDSRNAFVSGGYRDDAFEFGITIDSADTDGFSPSLTADIDRGYDNLTVNAYARAPYDGGDVSLRLWNADGNVEYLDFFLSPVDQDFTNNTTALQWNHTLGDFGSSSLIVSQMQDEIRQNQIPDFVDSTRTTVDWQLSRTMGNNLLTGGLFFVDENAEALSFGSPFDEDTDVRAVFVQNQWSGQNQRVFAALRVTDYDSFGTETTWNLEYARDLRDDLTLNVGTARAFRAPDAFDRFGFGGDPDLNPEVATEWQAGLQYSPATRHEVSFDIYQNDIEDLIEFEFVNFTLVNVDEARVRGAELGYRYQGEGFTFSSSFTNQRAENRTTDTRLLRRAEQTVNVRYQQNIGQHRLGLSVLGSGHREDFGGTPLAGYVLANLSGIYQVSERIQLSARVENVLDTDYETAAGFRMQERSLFVELRTRW